MKYNNYKIDPKKFNTPAFVQYRCKRCGKLNKFTDRQKEYKCIKCNNKLGL